MTLLSSALHSFADFFDLTAIEEKCNPFFFGIMCFEEIACDAGSPAAIDG
jgi:hypothetical protein